jgi:hypothetical protein
VEPELAAALEPVLVDLSGPGGVVPDVRDERWSRAARTAGAVLYDAGGFGMGVSIDLGQPRPSQIAAVADQVQEWAVEALWFLGRPTNWPACPHHPDRHPLAAEERDGRAVWTCPADHTEIAEIGTFAT